jgi:hypothetical protein
MRENATHKKSLLLRFGLLAGFRVFLWKGEEIVSRIFFAPLPKPPVHRMRSTEDPFPASSWSMIGTKPCCMVLDGNRLEIHVLSDMTVN